MYLMGVVFTFGLLPLLLAVGGFILFVFFLIGCLVSLSGITGFIMNFLYKRKMKDKSYQPTKPGWNTFSIIYGIVYMLFPFILIVVGIASVM